MAANSYLLPKNLVTYFLARHVDVTEPLTFHISGKLSTSQINFCRQHNLIIKERNNVTNGQNCIKLYNYSFIKLSFIDSKYWHLKNQITHTSFFCCCCFSKDASNKQFIVVYEKDSYHR